MMTSSDQQGGPSRGDDDALDKTQRLPGRSSRSRSKIRPATSRFKRARVPIGLAVLMLAGLSAALVYIATGGTHQTASSGSSVSNGSSVAGATPGTTSPAGGGTVPKGTSTTKGSVISAAKLAQNGGALSLPKSMQASVTSWQAGPGGKDLTTVSTQMGTALQAGGIRQYTAMKYACTQLASDVAAAEAGPSIPDATMQQLYTTALAELAKGAADCRSAISVTPDGDESDATHVDTTMLNQSISELSSGARDIFRSTAEIEIASRQHH
jgi:hypothetical protein